MVTNGQANSVELNQTKLVLSKEENVVASVSLLRVITPSPDVVPVAQERREPIPRELRNQPSNKVQSYPQTSGEVQKLYPNSTNNCVSFAWSQGMQTRGYHYASAYPVRRTVGKFASTYEGDWRGHIVVIISDNGDTLTVEDSNYIPNYITRREISKSIVKGFLD